MRSTPFIESLESRQFLSASLALSSFPSTGGLTVAVSSQPLHLTRARLLNLTGNYTGRILLGRGADITVAPFIDWIDGPSAGRVRSVTLDLSGTTRGILTGTLVVNGLGSFQLTGVARGRNLVLVSTDSETLLKARIDKGGLFLTGKFRDITDDQLVTGKVTLVSDVLRDRFLLRDDRFPIITPFGSNASLVGLGAIGNVFNAGNLGARSLGNVGTGIGFFTTPGLFSPRSITF